MLIIKLYADSIINTLGVLFKIIDYIEIDTLISNSIFKVLKYNLYKHNKRIFNL